jgi:hypothetical protein
LPEDDLPSIGTGTASIAAALVIGLPEVGILNGKASLRMDADRLYLKQPLSGAYYTCVTG